MNFERRACGFRQADQTQADTNSRCTLGFREETKDSDRLLPHPSPLRSPLRSVSNHTELDQSDVRRSCAPVYPSHAIASLPWQPVDVGLAVSAEKSAEPLQIKHRHHACELVARPFCSKSVLQTPVTCRAAVILKVSFKELPYICLSYKFLVL